MLGTPACFGTYSSQILSCRWTNCSREGGHRKEQSSTESVFRGTSSKSTAASHYRWGTWLEAAKYYSDNFITAEAIIQSWVNCGQLVQNAKIAILNVDLRQELIEINRFYPAREKLKNESWTMLQYCKPYCIGVERGWPSSPIHEERLGA